MWDADLAGRKEIVEAVWTVDLWAGGRAALKVALKAVEKVVM